MDYLLELLETYMIEDTKRHFDKMHDLVLAERLRDDDNLPLDLWKTVVYVIQLYCVCGCLWMGGCGCL